MKARKIILLKQKKTKQNEPKKGKKKPPNQPTKIWWVNLASQ